ncbi:uncharacterized protein UHOD_05787 [Ustilago sp. UG-2017b]|nr:uncharacterized protein UHOD_05787 [Ustilago sp. UG-2017b]
MAVSPLDALLATFDRHIGSRSSAASSAVAGPSSLKLRRNDLRNLINGSSAIPSTSSVQPQLSPLERAIHYEVENRRHALHRKQKELDFWETYENELADTPMKMPTSTAALERQIADKKQRLRELQGQSRLRVETARALESSAVIQKLLSTTSPTAKGKKGDSGEEETEESKRYASTRNLLEVRDDQALEFLKIFNEIREVKKERVTVKARIREQRLETLKLLETIKGIKADIRNRQLHPSSGGRQQDSDGSQDIAIVQKVQQMQREINEARSKKELVKGILRGLILESGRDWTKSTVTRGLMLSLADEDDASDDAFGEDEEEREEGDDDEEDEEIDEDDEVEHLEDE